MSDMSNPLEAGSVETRSRSSKSETKSDRSDLSDLSDQLEGAGERSPESSLAQTEIEDVENLDSTGTITPAAPAEIDQSEAIEESIDSNEQITERSPLLRGLITMLLSAMAVGAVGAAVHFAITLLVNPKPLSVFMPQEELSCKAKINGQWQTNWGQISFREQPDSNLVIADYAFQNLNRGKVEGKLEGKLIGNTLNFDWQETAQRGTRSLQGRGSFLFTNHCQDFTGSYGLEQSQSGWGNWSGQLLEVVPLS
ncbi:hypothetical protein Pse7367_2823 [Thalassoporum mexicanum PCC 7367]|uniref:hypothetical protein n=1 Tax=Thalassoporum mexicanum TaxID=3457544 RepID=UPI00029FE6E6|nr:hypothetical protein [Pseudanabaena sp. PCC 7367]AFY71076.1 hypothetical protein Pse7367_2823 [Pseudanabaena sp. PCC 7367]